MSPETILVIALSLIFGVIGARLFKIIRVPQVVGYIIIGLLLGVSVTHILTKDLISEFRPINYIALGIIGFLVGGELKKSVFKKFGKSMIIILLCEGILAFLFVTILTGLFTKNWSLAIILGALASATAPAATVDVLWEFKSAGVLTTMIFAIVALDDGLALLLYAFANSIAQVLINHSGFSLYATVLKPLYSIGGALLLGIAVAVIFRLVLDITKSYKHEQDLMLSFIFGSIMLIIALALKFHFSMILAEMFFGATFVNIAPFYSQKVFDSMKSFSPPIYILFFVLAGARLELNSLTAFTIIAALLYLIGRTAGKISGAAVGALISHSPKKVGKYLGLGLFSQAGVTIGLAISAFHTFPSLGLSIINIVTLTTFIVQVIGPPFVKLAITKANEIHKDITEEEMLEKHTVESVMKIDVPVLKRIAIITDILDAFSESNLDEIPVVNDSEEICGIISLAQIKPLLNRDIPANLVIAQEIMFPIVHTIYPKQNLKEAYNTMIRNNMQCLIVVAEDNHKKMLGMIDISRIKEIMREETIKLRELKV